MITRMITNSVDHDLLLCFWAVNCAKNIFTVTQGYRIMISLWLICILVENFMIFQCIIGLTLLFSLICVFLMIKKLRQQPRQTLSPLMTVKLCCSGILAFI